MQMKDDVSSIVSQCNTMHLQLTYVRILLCNIGQIQCLAVSSNCTHSLCQETPCTVVTTE